MKNTILLFFLIFALPVYAVDSSKPLSSYIYEFHDTSNGLPQNSASSFAQNSKGFMYISTQEGLVKFDGVTMDIFDTSNLNRLHSDLIRKVVADKNDNVFLATDKGLIQYSAKADVIDDYIRKNSINYSDVYDISITDDSTVIFGVVAGKGIFDLSIGNGDVNFYTPENKKISTKNINSVKAFSAKEVYAATRSGLYSLDITGNFQKIPGSDDSFSAITKDRSGIIWAVGAEGLYKLDKKRIVKHFKLEDGLPFKYLSTVFADSSGTIWFGSSVNGLGKYRNGKFDHILETDKTKFRNILTITEDREKNIWVGTAIDGFIIIKEGCVVDSKLKDHLVLGVTEDIKGNIWCNSLGKGAVKISPKGQETLINETIGLNLYTILGDSKGRVWVSSRNNGIFISENSLNFSSVENYFTSTEPFPLNPSVFFEGSFKSIWTNDRDKKASVYKFSGNKMIRYELPAKNAVVTDIVENSNETVFVSTKQNGIFRFDQVTGKFVKIKTFHSNFFVHNMYFDSKDRLWMSTHNNGIFIYVDGDIIKLGLNIGLFDDNVHSITEDRRNNFWFTTNKGVFTISSQDIERFLSGDSTTVNSKVFNESDGMPSRECNGGVKPSTHITGKGHIWIPTIKGIVKIDPENTGKTVKTAPISFTWLIIDNNHKNRVRIYDTKTIELPPETKNIEVHYSSPSFSNPGNILFDHWVNSEQIVKGTKRRFITLSNLEPGIFKFNVKSYISDKKKTPSKNTITFNIIKPLYLTDHFKYSSVAAGILAVLLLFLMTKRVSRKRQEEMMTTINEKTFELQMMNRELEEAVVKDPLTNLKNRRFMFEFEEANIRSFIESKERTTHLLENRTDSYGKEEILSILMLDIDHFKRINDLYGHTTGDMVLVDIAGILLKSVREKDCVIRWGGEEFLVLLKNIKRDKAADIAEKIRKNIEKFPFRTENGKTIWLTVSIGVAFIPFFDHAPNLLSVDNIISIADLALYSSKNKGRDQTTIVSAGKNIPSSTEQLMGMLASAQYSELNGFYTFKKITSDNYEEFDLEEVQ